MPTKESPETFASIDSEALETVAGGASSRDAQLTATLNSITSSIADLSKNQNQMDPTMMLMMVMMMGGGGGGGPVYAAAPAAAGPPVINVDTSVAGGGRPWGFGGCGLPAFGGGGCGRKGGKKGW